MQQQQQNKQNNCSSRLIQLLKSFDLVFYYQVHPKQQQFPFRLYLNNLIYLPLQSQQLAQKSSSPKAQIKLSQLAFSIIQSYNKRYQYPLYLSSLNSSHYQRKILPSQKQSDFKFLRFLPKNGFVIIIFQLLEYNRQYFKTTVYNLQGSILFNAIRSIQIKQSTILALIKRKIKQHSCLLIYSKIEDYKQQGIYNILKKLLYQIKFIYISKFKNQKQSQKFDQLEKAHSQQSIIAIKSIKKRNIIYQSIQLSKQNLFLIEKYGCSQVTNNNALIQFCNEFYEKVTTFENTIKDTVSWKSSKNIDYVLRLNLMMNNFVHYSDKNNFRIYNIQDQIDTLIVQKSQVLKQQLVQLMNNQQKRNNHNQQEGMHVAQKMERCKLCQYCKIAQLPKIKKSKFSCQQCAKILKCLVPLCILHFQAFHANMEENLDILRERMAHPNRRLSVKRQKNKKIKKPRQIQSIEQEQSQNICQIDRNNINQQVNQNRQQYGLQKLDKSIKQYIECMEQLKQFDDNERIKSLYNRQVADTLDKINKKCGYIKRYTN